MMAAVLEDDAALTAALHGAAGELQIVASMDHGATVLMGEDVMIPDDRHVLQLWAIEDGEPVGMGTFRPTGAGQVSLLIEAGDGRGAGLLVGTHRRIRESATGGAFPSGKARICSGWSPIVMNAL